MTAVSMPPDAVIQTARSATADVCDAKGGSDCGATPAGLWWPAWPEANSMSARGGQCVTQRLALALAQAGDPARWGNPGLLHQRADLGRTVARQAAQQRGDLGPADCGVGLGPPSTAGMLSVPWATASSSCLRAARAAIA